MRSTFPSAVRCPRDGGTLQAPLCSPRRPILRRQDRTGEITKEKSPNERERPNRETEENTARPLVLVCGCREGGRGKEQRKLLLGPTSPPHGTQLLRPTIRAETAGTYLAHMSLHDRASTVLQTQLSAIQTHPPRWQPHTNERRLRL